MQLEGTTAITILINPYQFFIRRLALANHVEDLPYYQLHSPWNAHIRWGRRSLDTLHWVTTTRYVRPLFDVRFF